MHIKPQISKNKLALDRKTVKKLVAMGRTSQPQSPHSSPTSPNISRQHKNEGLSPSQNEVLMNSQLDVHLSPSNKPTKEPKKHLLELKPGQHVKLESRKKIIPKGSSNHEEKPKKSTSKSEKKSFEKEVKLSQKLEKELLKAEKELNKKSEKDTQKPAEIKKLERIQQKDTKKPEKVKIDKDCKLTEKNIQRKVIKEGSKVAVPTSKKIKKMLKKVKKTKPKEKLQLSANYNKKRRVHRMASLNALAKVHILYENDSRCSPSDGSETENVACEIPTVKTVIDVKNSGMPCVTTNSCKPIAIKSEVKSSCSKPPTPKKSKVEQSSSELLKPKGKQVKSKKDKVDTKNDKINEDSKRLEKSPKSVIKKKNVEDKVKKPRKRKAICDVEIIDTKTCKRLACLNAQAILAASCSPDRNRRITEKKICKVDEILINEKEIMTYNHEIVTDQSITTQVTNHQQTCTTVIRQKPAAKQANNRSIHHNLVQTSGRVVDTRVEPKGGLSCPSETCESGKTKANHKLCKLRAITASNDVEIPSEVEATVSKMGVTAEYTEVTKVHINTTKAMQVKEECKAKRTTIERILEKDDVAITRMYHYQTKGTSQSYCVKMHTTYKPSANKSFPTPPPAVVQNKASSLGDTPEIISTTVVHSDPGYYNYNPPVPVPTPQNFSINQNTVARVNGVPVVSVSPIVRHYSSSLQQNSSSAFTVPQYGTSSPSHTSQNSYSQEYSSKQGYYSQGVQDPLMVHKPIPYHPPQSPPHQPHSTVGQAPVPTHHPPSHVVPPHAHQTNSCSSPSHPYPPPAHSTYPAQDPYLAYSSPHGNTYHQMEPVLNPPHHATFNRVSPHMANSAYPSQDVSHPQPAHYHPYHQRSPMHHPTYPPTISPSPTSNPHPPSPSYHSSTHGSPFTQRHVYSSPSHSPSYQHQDYSNGPVYTVLSPVPMGTKKSNHLQQRINQAVVSPGAMHCTPRSSRNSPETIPKSEPTMPPDMNIQSQNTFQSNLASNGNYFPQPSYPPTDNARLSRPSNRSNVAGVTPVMKKMIQPITGNSRSTTDCCNIECYGDQRLRDNSKGVSSRDVGSYKSLQTVQHFDSGSSKPVITTSRKAKTTCHFTRVQNVEVTTTGNKQSSQRRLRAATMAATNSSLIAQRQNQQLSMDKVGKCSPSSQTIASSISSSSIKKKSNSRLHSSPDKSVPIEIDLTMPETIILNKRVDDSPQTPSSVKKAKRNSLEVEILENVPEPEPKGMELIPMSLCSMIPKKKGPKKFSNGWSWEGEPFDKLVFHSNDDPPLVRRCYPAMRHMEGDLIHPRDCVLLKSGPRKIDLPFVAKVTALWETPEEGEMMISLLWYYRPEHTEQGRRPIDLEDEIFASKHRDVNSVACIEDKCYVLTSSEYCRYRSRLRMFEDNCLPSSSAVPEPEDGYPRKSRLPPGRVSPEMVFVCRKVYDFRQKRLLKNPV